MWPAPPGVGLWTPDLLVIANLLLVTCMYLWGAGVEGVTMPASATKAHH